MKLNWAVRGYTKVKSASLGVLRIRRSVATCALGCSRKRLGMVYIRPDLYQLGTDQICIGAVYSYTGPPGQPAELHTIKECKSALTSVGLPSRPLSKRERLQAVAAELKWDCYRMISKIKGLEDKIRQINKSKQPKAGLEGSEKPDEGIEGAKLSRIIDLEGSKGSE